MTVGVLNASSGDAGDPDRRYLMRVEGDKLSKLDLSRGGVYGSKVGLFDGW